MIMNAHWKWDSVLVLDHIILLTMKCFWLFHSEWSIMDCKTVTTMQLW